MAYTREPGVERGTYRDTMPGVNEALLRSEIGFWQEMIDSSDGRQPAESIERMRHALALAETRLEQLFVEYRESVDTDGECPNNVFRLDRSRGRLR